MQSKQLIKLSDYQPIPYEVSSIELFFDIRADKTLVTNILELQLKSSHLQGAQVVLDGSPNLKLLSMKYDGNLVQDSNYKIDENHLVFSPQDLKFKLEILTEINPELNHSLMGLYKVNDTYITQNESDGFRNITYYYDRPDVMTKFTVKIEASKNYPYLLSNGNLIKNGELSDNRHFAIWHDPFPKPCYLFALVAGDFDILRDSYTTKSHKKVQLEIYVDKGYLPLTTHAMSSLKKSMKWDEDRFNLEYDLDRFMIVSTNSFNFGAMENKGLNIFNSKYILGDEQTATDEDLEAIESVIGHEYFHNWTGNRITCREWFQITLKEGLTVFRDQEFTSDLHSRGVKRIKDVKNLRENQFEQDASPFAHPIRPEEYIEINNFYTVTVYEKGSEVIRMIHTILGEEKFQEGMKKYFELYDGKAVTTEDFLSAMCAVYPLDLESFIPWYSQKGTPIVKVSEKYNRNNRTLEVVLQQSLEDHPSYKEFYIPFNFALFNDHGKIDLTQVSVNVVEGKKTVVEGLKSLIHFKDRCAQIEFKNVSDSTVLSINRGFSAPVKVEQESSISKIETIVKFEDDPFQIWDQGQEVFRSFLLEKMDSHLSPQPNQDEFFVEKLCDKVLRSLHFDDSFKALFLTIPGEREVNEWLPIYHFERVAHECRNLKKNIALYLSHTATELYSSLRKNKSSDWNPQNNGRRRLSLKLLEYIVLDPNLEKMAEEFCLKHFYESNSMTDILGVLEIVNKYDVKIKKDLNQKFIDQWKSNDLLINKWLGVQMLAPSKDELRTTLVELENHSLFDFKIPNRVYALHMGFMNNSGSFHFSDGQSYQMMAERIVKIDQFNSMVAARLVKGFKNLNRLPEHLKEKEMISLEYLLAQKNLSKNCYEIAERFFKN